jgi:hypothetical protein
VTPKDVIAPLVGLMSVSLLVLLVWTFVNPLQWQRLYKTGLDRFGRPKESYGSCVSPGPGSTACMSILLVIDAAALIVANFQAYRARNITTEFSESQYIQIAVVSILQAGIIGVPMSVIVHGYPPAFFFVVASFIFISSISIVSLIFIPKIMYLRQKGKLAKSRDSDRTGCTGPSHSSMYSRGGPQKNRDVRGVTRSAHMSSVTQTGFSSSMLNSGLTIPAPHQLEILRAAARGTHGSEISCVESITTSSAEDVTEDSSVSHASILKAPRAGSLLSDAGASKINQPASTLAHHAVLLEADDTKKRTAAGTTSRPTVLKQLGSSFSRPSRRFSLPVASFNDKRGHLQIDQPPLDMDRASFGSDGAEDFGMRIIRSDGAEDFGMRIMANPFEEELDDLKKQLVRTARQLSARELELLATNMERKELVSELTSLINSSASMDKDDVEGGVDASLALAAITDQSVTVDSREGGEKWAGDVRLKKCADANKGDAGHSGRRQSQVVLIEKAKLQELLKLAGSPGQGDHGNTDNIIRHAYKKGRQRRSSVTVDSREGGEKWAGLKKCADANKGDAGHSGRRQSQVVQLEKPKVQELLKLAGSPGQGDHGNTDKIIRHAYKKGRQRRSSVTVDSREGGEKWAGLKKCADAIKGDAGHIGRRQSQVVQLEKPKVQELLKLAGSPGQGDHGNTDNRIRHAYKSGRHRRNSVTTRPKLSKVQFHEDCLLQEQKIGNVRDEYNEALDAILPIPTTPSLSKNDGDDGDEDNGEEMLNKDDSATPDVADA